MLAPVLLVAGLALAGDSDGPAERWVRELRIWTANDGWADVRDSHRRSDEGATASFGIRWIERFAGDRRGRFDVAYFIFTEPGGDLRSDWMRLDAHWGHVGNTTSWFDRWLVEAGVGLQITGDLGGATLQNEIHTLTVSTIDLTYETGLQATYSGGLRAAGVLSARGYAERRGGWLLFGIGADAYLPAGNTGLGWVGGDIRVRVGPPSGFYADFGLRLAAQWRLGGAFDFEGAPTDGGVIIPSLALGWAGAHWVFEGRWERNHCGTERGMGTTRDNESVTLSLARRW